MPCPYNHAAQSELLLQRPFTVNRPLFWRADFRFVDKHGPTIPPARPGSLDLAPS
jgi:hypothetical protein